MRETQQTDVFQQPAKGEEVGRKMPRYSDENRKESRNREIIRIGEEGAPGLDG
jgi:hypothetical protein